MRNGMYNDGNGRWSRWRRFDWLAFAFVVFFAAGWPASGASLTATLERDSIALGESVSLQLVFEGCQPQSAPAPPAVTNLSIQFVGHANRTIIINNQVSPQVILSYTVTPSREGEYVIPPFVAEVGGQRLASQPLTLKVGKSTQAEWSKYAFLRWSIPKTNLYVGETLPVELQLYALRINGGDFPQINAEGLTIGKLNQPSQSRTQVGNRLFTVLTFRTFIAPTRAGELKLGPTSMKINIPKPNQRRRSPFDSLFDDDFFFGGTEWQPVVVTHDAITINARALPVTNQPPSFTGAVGNYSMNVKVSPTNVAVGDPITVRVEISGSGQLDGLLLPEQPAWREFKVYPPTSKVENADQLGLGGTKIFEQVLVAQNTELRELPPFEFSYFDTTAGAYRTLRGPRFPLIVRPSGGGQSFRVEEESARTPDLVHIKQNPGAFVAVQTPLALRPGFLALQALPVVLWLAAWLRRKNIERLAADPRLRRRRETARFVANGLRELANLAAQKKSEEFFALVFRLLQEQIGEMVDLPASAITEAVIEERLRPAGVKPETLKQLQELFQICNFARYAPVKTAKELDAVQAKLRQVLDELKEVRL